MELRNQIVEAFSDRALLQNESYKDAVRQVIEEVDKGRLRTAEKIGDTWQVNEWVKQAILMYFSIQPMETHSIPPFEFYDKMKFGLIKANINCI